MSDKKGNAMSSSGSERWGWTKKVTSVHLQWGIIVFTLLGVLVLSIAMVAATPLAIAGVAILILLRFNDISDVIVEGFGAKVSLGRMRTAIKEANEAAEKAEAAIEQLKSMSVTMAVISLMESVGEAATPALLPSTLSFAIQKRKTIQDNLKRLEFTADFIDEVLSMPDALIIQRVVHQVLFAMSLEPEQHREALRRVDEVSTTRPVDVSRVVGVLRGYQQNAKSDALIGVIEEFGATKQIDKVKMEEALSMQLDDAH